MTHTHQNWRTYQKELKRRAARRRLRNITVKYAYLVPVFIIGFYAVTLAMGHKSSTGSHSPDPSASPPVVQTTPAAPPSVTPAEPPVPVVAADSETPQEKDLVSVSEPAAAPDAPPQVIVPVNGEMFTKSELRNLIQDKDLANIRQKNFKIDVEGKSFQVSTSLDMDLQNFLLDRVQDAKKLKRGRPRYLAMVALNPETGKVLSMAGFDKTDPGGNPCLSNDFPAASVFKIITAAAAVEKCGLNPNSNLNFRGSRYTLYKGQIKDESGKRDNSITFIESFAQSVNPVFAKIGLYKVGRNVIEKYASAFGFNHPIDFEAPVQMSETTIPDQPFGIAEIACGFNRITQISPLHGALLSGTIVNNGRLTTPTIIEQIVDDEGNIVYKGTESPKRQVIQPETSSVLRQLMASTITDGTGRKSFQGFTKDPVLAQLNIGGKTGSIDNNVHDVRFDWFVGFAEDKKGSQKLAICVLVGHEKYIGTKACYYARMAMKHYFGNQFARNDQKNFMAFNDTVTFD
jgi:cell division protein FtsI/penicillin-binding protein 2